MAAAAAVLMKFSMSLLRMPGASRVAPSQLSSAWEQWIYARRGMAAQAG